MPTLSDEQKSLSALCDEDLMHRYGEGEMDAFEELFQRHKSSVYAFIYHFTHGVGAIEDLFQTVFLRVVRYRKRYKAKAKFTTWLFTITRSVCIDAIRKQKTADVIQLFPQSHNDNDPLDAANFPGRGPSPLDATYESELQEAIDEIIASLSPEQREVLLLREKTDLTFDEIGEIIDCSANTAKSRMHYALLALRKGLRERGFEEP
ncbi:MAG: sigma-70 family RNA polymerase sigma factor [Candidatus Omnitrophica bacterium]|nr:sigma-70 family RNA polymerase sigma factor [Candidatus Omnitrophota bacterium]